MAQGHSPHQRLLGKYSLWEIPHDPGTMMAVGAAGSLAGSAISATGALGSGSAAQQAGQMAATAAINSSQITAEGQELAGKFQGEEAEYEAEELTQNASTTRAAAQRQALDIGQQTKLALSSLRAQSSGNGLTSTGETPVAIAGQIGARGTYMQLGVMAAGENTARGEEDEATAARLSGAAAVYGGNVSAVATRYGGQATAAADIFQGNAAKTASEFQAAGTLASGFGAAASQYGMAKYPMLYGRAPGVG